jgi:pimeloyl-ACP methyl ester carboxylesterase
VRQHVAEMFKSAARERGNRLRMRRALSALSIFVGASAVGCGGGSATVGAGPDGGSSDAPDTRAGAVDAGDSSASAPPTFIPGACGLSIHVSADWHRSCGTVAVPLQRVAPAPSESKLDIYVERFDNGPGPTIVYLTGGPGIGLDAYAGLGVLDKVIAAVPSGEVIFLEQRGNARSPGDLSCHAGEDDRVCLARLTTAGLHPEAYNSVESASDVADVLSAFGRDRATLWGHSYGSALAQVVTENHPTRVASLILEGVLDPLTPEPTDPVPNRETSLGAFGNWFSKRCAADPTCAAQYPTGLDPVADFQKLVSSLSDPSMTVPLTTTASLSQDDLQSWFLNGLATYDGMLAFVELVHAAVLSTPSDPSAMNAWLSAIGKGDPNVGANAVQGFLRALGAATVAVSQDVKDCFDEVNSFAKEPVCAPLSRTQYGSDQFALAFHSAVPSLFLTGALDTQTLPPEATAVRNRLSNVVEVVFGSCIGHFSFLDSGTCGDGVVKSFLGGMSPVVTPACAAASACDSMPLLPRLGG